MSIQYGFHQTTFDILKKKSFLLKPEENQGNLRNCFSINLVTYIYLCCRIIGDSYD